MLCSFCHSLNLALFLVNYANAYFRKLRLAVISRKSVEGLISVNIIVAAICNLDLPTLQTLAAATNIFNFPATPGVPYPTLWLRCARCVWVYGVCVWKRREHSNLKQGDVARMTTRTTMLEMWFTVAADEEIVLKITKAPS